MAERFFEQRLAGLDEAPGPTRPSAQRWQGVVVMGDFVEGAFAGAFLGAFVGAAVAGGSGGDAGSGGQIGLLIGAVVGILAALA